MRAIRVHEFGGPDVMKLEDTPDPQPGAGEVVVTVEAVGVNPVETYIRAGIYGPREFPFTPGSDAAGTVETVGDGVAHVRPGDRVYSAGSVSGTYAQKTLCQAAQVQPLPGHVTFEQGAALGVPYVTAYRGLFQRAGAIPGETVLVHGASGGVGLAAVQMAVAAGMTVIATGGTEEGRKLVSEQGAAHVLDHHAGGYLDQIKPLTGGRGVDVILEMLANVNLGKDLGLLAPQGRVIVIGSRGKVEIDPRDTMSRDADIRGMAGPNIGEAERRSIHAALIAGLKNGTLRPIVGRTMPLADAPRAHEEVMRPSGALGKIVLRP
ncbi:MAG: NADPH:quinone reductase [Armatimonadetes bacterium]|nr:NADPH:quinone reductase [Armatimonadota bacterium]